MLILGAMVFGILLLMFAFAIFSMSFWSDEGRYWVWFFAALFAIPGGYMLVWAITSIIQLS